MEVVVTMVISAVLIGITYTSYRIISVSYASFHIKNENLSTVERLDELLKKDFSRAERIEKSDAGLLIQSAGNFIHYEFVPEAIIRISSVQDTFRIKNGRPIYSFEGQLIEEPGVISNLPKRIDDMAIPVMIENEPISFHYHKMYSSANFFNPDPNAIN
jgi:hypothetical protein